MRDFSEFERKLGVSFSNKNLLTEAFTHRSYLNENPSWGGGHNERLEFLGDAVLELAVTEHLFAYFPQKPEGELTSFRAALVNANMLSEIAQGLGMNEYLLLSRGEAKDIGRARQYILANAFEALVGALYLDQGYEVSKKFVLAEVSARLEEVLSRRLFRDPKSLFQEKAQDLLRVTPGYRVLREWGPDHDKHFVVGVYLAEELAAEGEGSSKQEAEVDAASRALKIKKWGDD